MAKCMYCGIETKCFIGSEPICDACEGNRERPDKKSAANASPNNDSCWTCERLRAECARLDRAYWAALAAMKARRGTPREIFAPLPVVLNEAWRDFELAELELENHQRRSHSQLTMAAG